MTQPGQPTEAQPQVWGDPSAPPPAPGPRWSGKKTLAAVGVALVLAAAGGVAVYAASGTATEAVTQGAGPGGGRMMTAGPMGALATALHGEFVASDGKGGYENQVMQNGAVTEITPASVTVKSTDGFTKTYVIGQATTFGRSSAADIAAGDTVTVIAASDGAAKSVLELGQSGQAPDSGPGRPSRPRAPDHPGPASSS